MHRRGIWTMRILSALKKLFLLAALAALGYGGYVYYMSSRPALPDVGADWVAFQYLTALRNHDYETAYLLASASAQSHTSPATMGEQCKEVYSSIDDWQLGGARYGFTHTSASVPVTLRYRAAWSPQEASQMAGNLDFTLETGQWRLVVAVPFATAIMKQRDEQHFGGNRR
jgi:hypothetical protein